MLAGQLAAFATEVANHIKTVLTPRLLPDGGELGQTVIRSGSGYAWTNAASGPGLTRAQETLQTALSNAALRYNNNRLTRGDRKSVV